MYSMSTVRIDCPITSESAAWTMSILASDRQKPIHKTDSPSSRPLRLMMLAAVARQRIIDAIGHVVTSRSGAFTVSVTSQRTRTSRRTCRLTDRRTRRGHFSRDTIRYEMLF